VSWTYLNFLLIHVGYDLGLVNWVMGSVMSSSFSVLINGASSTFLSPLEDFTKVSLSHLNFYLLLQKAHMNVY